MELESLLVGLFFGCLLGILLTLITPLCRKMIRKRVCGSKEEEHDTEAPVKRMPDSNRSTSTQAIAPDIQKRLSIEVPEPPLLSDPNYYSDEPDDNGGLKRRTTDSEMDKTCETASFDDQQAPQLDHVNDDSEAVFEDWKTQLYDICVTLNSLKPKVKGNSAKKLYKKTLQNLEELRDRVCQEADLVGQMRSFLLNIQDDEGVEEDEREVAKWITTSFLNAGEGNTWAAAFHDEEDMSTKSNFFRRISQASQTIANTDERTAAMALAISPTAKSTQSNSAPPSRPKLFQRFNSERLRSVSSVSSVNLQGDHSRDEDEKTLERNTETPYSQFIFYQAQPEILKVLEGLGTWEFDIFEVEEMVGDLMLPLLGVTICKKLKGHKLNKFHDLPEQTIFDYLLALNKAYHPRSEVSYHNSLHAADVMCSSYSLIMSNKFDTFDHLQIVALILAAAAHDVDHDGYNNTFHINSGTKLALKYNDRSVLENHHCAVGWKLAIQHNVIKALPREQRNTFRNIFISSILATDMTGHGDQLKTLGELHGADSITTPADQIRLLGHILHSADISNVGKPYEYCNIWVKLVMDEFFRQGDKEKDLKLPVSPLCDRQKTDVDASEVGFIKFVVKPWFESLAKVLPESCENCLNHINMNYRTFKDRALRTQELKQNNTERPSLTRRSVLLNAAEGGIRRGSGPLMPGLLKGTENRERRSISVGELRQGRTSSSMPASVLVAIAETP